MSLSIRWRLTIWIVAALLLTLMAILLTVRLALGSILQADLDDDLSRELGQVSAQVALTGSLDPARLQEIVELYSGGRPSDASVVVFRDRGGGVLAATAGVDVSGLVLGPEELEDGLDGEVLSRDLDLGEGGDLRVRTARLTVGSEVVGVVQVAEDREAASHPLERLQTILLVEGAVAAAVAVAGGYWLARGAVRPLEGVANTAAEIEASDLGRRIHARGQPAEVQKLADTFDAMLERLGAAFEQQRNFVMDMSHEMRTPLTALRGNIDVLLMDERLDGETRTQLDRMSAEVGRLIRLTSNLLYLAHAEAGRELDHRPVELDLLCLEVYRQSKDLRPGVRLRLGREDQVTVVGDRDLLKQLILNLVDNGLKYTQTGGQVTLSLFRDESWARIVVEDTGPGIPDAQLPNIFQRFYRASDSGRRASGGAGIGLAISDWIARAHGGRITVESQVGKGSAFTVHIPLAPDADCHAQPGAEV